MPHPTPIGIRHEMLALALEGMRQSAIAGHMGLTHATINRIFQRHVANGTLVPDKSTGASWKTTPHQDHALLRMVWQECFISAWALDDVGEEFVWNEGWPESINNWLLSSGYHAYIATSNTFLTANYCSLCLEWAQKKTQTMAHWQHVIIGDEFRFQLYPVDGRLRVRCLPGEHFQQRCQAYRVQAGGGSVHLWEAFHSGSKMPLSLPDRYLTSELYRDIL